MEKYKQFLQLLYADCDNHTTAKDALRAHLALLCFVRDKFAIPQEQQDFLNLIENQDIKSLLSTL